MTREELVGEAKDLIRLCERAAGHVAKHPDEGANFSTTYRPRKANLTDILKAYLALAKPEWKDTPDGDGLYWIDCYDYCTLTTVVGEWAWTHGLKQPVNSFKDAQWAEAELPVGPDREKKSG